jgi:hypothetical protein
MTAPKERPILFSAPMVRAILDGRQTQTRRIVKPQPHAGVRKSPFVASGLEDGHGRGLRCPFGAPGDRLWCRETFSYTHNDAQGFSDTGEVWYWADGNPQDGDWSKPRPSIHMPRWASRITLEITDVRVQRLQEISEEDAVAEGVFRPTGERTPIGQVVETHNGGSLIYAVRGQACECFRDLWQSIHGPGSWEASPWVWALTFRRVER